MSWPVPSLRLVFAALLGSALILILPDLGRVDLALFELDGRFVLANALLLAAGVVDYILAPSPTGFGVQRVHPAAITLGNQASLEWRISRKDGSRSSRVQVADEIAPSLQPGARRFGVTVPARGTATARTELSPTRRGRFEPTDMVLRTAGPLGLTWKQRKRREQTQLRVLPPFRSAKEAELSLRRARILEVGLRSAKGRGGGTDFDSLRELSPDDETRRIDWAATARSNRPIVRTFRAERNQTVMCLLDSGRVMAGRIEDVPRLEHAMDGAMLLAELATGLGDRMGLIAFDETPHTIIPPTNRRSQRSRVAEQLFDLYPALVGTDYQVMATHFLARFRRRSFVVLMTDLGLEAVTEYLLPALPLLVRKHYVVVASVSDPDVVFWATQPSADEGSVFLRSAAISEMENRRRAAALIRGTGATVLDLPPDGFATALGDAYLKAKATGGV